MPTVKHISVNWMLTEKEVQCLLFALDAYRTVQNLCRLNKDDSSEYLCATQLQCKVEKLLHEINSPF